MKRAQKFLLVCLTFLLVVTMVLPQGVLAAPKGKGGPWKAPKLKFKDIEKSWARDYIAQMAAAGILRGVSEDRFAPDDSVESAQVLTMLVRALGYEDRALAYDDDDLKQDYLRAVPDWAKGYVQVAVEKGIVTRQELRSWQRGQNATRLDVARYLAALLGGEADWDYNNADLKYLRFKDLAGIPANLRVYILIVSNAGIMTGDDMGNWMPRGLLNRGQMAKILALIIGRLAPAPGQSTRQVITGDIVRVRYRDNADEAYANVTVETSQGTSTYTVYEDCDIYVDGKAADLEDLKEGQRVRLLVSRSSSGETRVVYVRAESVKQEKVEAKGTISGLTLGLNASVTVRTDANREHTFQVDEDTEITLAGRSVFLSDLKRGQAVTVKGYREGNELVALEIAAEPDEQEIKGRVTAVVTNGRPTISVEDKKGTKLTFRVTSRTSIRLNDKRAVLEDLKPGDEVEVVASGNEALSIEATRPEPEEKEVSGKIAALVFGREPSLTVRTSAGRTATYKVTEDTRIILDGKRATLDVLRIGWEVELIVLENEALEVEATSPEPEEYELEGKLVQLKFGENNSLIVENEDGRQHELRIANNVRVRLDGKASTLWQLEIGMEVELHIKSGLVIAIEAQD
ncbi:MAG: S-layer homology domain-containing protein [bacterium]|jgi:hypothetical protein